MGPAPPLSASSLASRDEALALFLFDAHAPAGEARGDACEAFLQGCLSLDPCVLNGLVVILTRLWCPLARGVPLKLLRGQDARRSVT